MTLPSFFRSIRAKLLLIALLLLSIPFIGFRFILEMDGYLREGQQQVLGSAAKLLSASLSDRPQLFRIAAAETGSEDIERRRLLAMFGSADPEMAANLGAAYLPSEDIERILNVVASSVSRIWVVDSRSRVRGLAGTLSTPRTAVTSRDPDGGFAEIYSRVVRPIIGFVSSDMAGQAKDEGGQAQRAVMSQVERALIGEPNIRWRAAADGSGEILSIAQPVWQGDNIVGAVVVEETTRDRQSIRYAALESLLVTTAIVFLVGFVALVGFAWRLAFRVRRLQREADAAIDPHGRILGRISGSVTDDEIAALAQTLDETLQRLSRYNGYLEQMAARLSHELRTPVAVVRSSLDNLRQGNLIDEDRVYVDRADEGVRRLAALISRMAEATQLEGMLQSAEKSQFDMAVVIRSCVEGYRMAYPSHVVSAFELDMNPETGILLYGIPDSIAQLLDKLVQNAVDFAVLGTPVRISLETDSQRVVVSVENNGPLLPASAFPNLFVSMVSSRVQSSAQGDHLGLGLYIVRLIAEFHSGTVKAANLGDGSGVRFDVALPLVKA